MDGMAIVLRSQQNEPVLSLDGVCLWLGTNFLIAWMVGNGMANVKIRALLISKMQQADRSGMM